MSLTSCCATIDAQSEEEFQGSVNETPTDDDGPGRRVDGDVRQFVEETVDDRSAADRVDGSDSQYLYVHFLIFVHIYIYVCVCVCVCECLLWFAVIKDE